MSSCGAIRACKLTIALLGSLATAGCGGDGPEPRSSPGGSATTAAFGEVRDATGALTLDLPSEWVDRKLEKGKYPGSQLLRSDADAVLWASQDLQAFSFGLATDGVVVEASQALGKELAEVDPARDPVINRFLAFKPRLVVTRECPNGRFDLVGTAGPAFSRSRSGSLSDVATVAVKSIDALAKSGVVATWLCGQGTMIVESVFLTSEGSTLVYLQYVLPSTASVDSLTHVLQSLRIDSGKLSAS